ncbi:MAG: adenine deaminase [Bacteroidia bacterium]
MSEFKIEANFVDIRNRNIFPAEIEVKDGKIYSIKKIEKELSQYILPGFIDAHVHIESSLLIPSEFARMAVLHGTVGTISDPHEIANVCGIAGVDFMIQNGKKVPFHFCFGAPSCVPATVFETTGAKLLSNEVDTLLQRDDIYYLTEMMNFPGVLFQDAEVMAKLKSAQKYNKPIDGHAPGLRNEQAALYFSHGISTDHECFTYEEALDKAKLGVNILIREGSAARNFDVLIPLMKDYPQQIMFCSDDKHPDSLLEGHINSLVKRALQKGFDLFDILNAACIHPVEHYKMPVGTLQLNDNADFILLDDLTSFNIKQTFINGILVAENNTSFIQSVKEEAINQFECKLINESDFQFELKENNHVIECLDGELITNHLQLKKEECNLQHDVIYLAVVNRYQNAPIAVSLIKGLGLKNGAIAGSVAHDSHNILVTGTNFTDMKNAVNLLVKNKGGLSLAFGESQEVLPLPMAGLMSMNDAWEVAEKYTNLDRLSKSLLGSHFRAPYMTLSFMALLVIPHLKLSDLGLFDGDSFEFVS